MITPLRSPITAPESSGDGVEIWATMVVLVAILWGLVSWWVAALAAVALAAIAIAWISSQVGGSSEGAEWVEETPETPETIGGHPMPTYQTDPEPAQPKPSLPVTQKIYTPWG